MDRMTSRKPRVSLTPEGPMSRAPNDAPTAGRTARSGWAGVLGWLSGILGVLTVLGCVVDVVPDQQEPLGYTVAMLAVCAAGFGVLALE